MPLLDHTHHGPGSRLRLALVAALVPLTMCAGAPESRRVADRFMETYYGASNVADAVKLCTGAAKTKIEGELAAMRGMAPAAASDKPRVTYRLASETAAAGEATYVYEVDPRTSDVKPLTATLALASEGGQWLVTSITETRRGS
jgi:hypothetical protein